MSGSERWSKNTSLSCYTVWPGKQKPIPKVTESDKSMRISMPNSEQGSKSPIFHHGTRFGPACKNPSNKPPKWMKACELACPAQNNGPRIRVYHVTRSGPVSRNLYEKVTESDKSMRISMPTPEQWTKNTSLSCYTVWPGKQKPIPKSNRIR
jgi:hypothetical protein